MSYTKQNFVKGQILNADNLIKIENAIIESETEIEQTKSKMQEKAEKDFISDAFSTSKAYDAGEYCIYNNSLYKFTADKAAGFWDVSKVTPTTCGKEIQNSIKGNATLLLETSSVTTTETAFTLSESWKNYKLLFVTAEMNFSSTTDINLYNEIFFTDVIRTGMNYVVLREVASGSSNYTGFCKLKFNEVDGYNTVNMQKQSTTYNGCRNIRIYGIK